MATGKQEGPSQDPTDTSQGYAIVIIMKPKPDKFDDVWMFMRDVWIKIAKTEPGSRELNIMRSGDQILIFARWENEAAFDFHNEQDYTKAFYDTIPPMLQEQFVIYRAANVEHYDKESIFSYQV